MKYIMRLDGKHQLLAARAWAETGSAKGGSRCWAGESEQSPSMRLSLAAWWNAQTNTKWHSAGWLKCRNRSLGMSVFLTLKALY